MVSTNLTYLLYFSFLYILGLTLLYYSKTRMKNIENKIYKWLLGLNILGILLQICCDYVSAYYDFVPVIISQLILRLYLAYFIAWINTMFDYLLAIAFKGKRKIVWINIVLTVIESIIVMLLPFELFRDIPNKIYYTHGPAINITFAFSGIMMFIMILLIIIRYKTIEKKKVVPIFLFMTFGVIAALIQQADPSIIIIAPMETFICSLMYFTIENPDMKLINELNIAKDQAERANNAKSEFLSSMSHEIRTPLNAIVGFSQALIEDKDIPEHAKDEIKDIVMASDSLLEIVNGILDISKIEANKLEIINSEYSFHKIFDELVVLTKARLGEKELEFKYQYDESIPGILYGDHIRLKQIILNLLTNSVKYTNKGSINFKVNSILKDGVCRLIISVEDTGIGIKNDKIDKLFTKFERLDVEKNSTVEGTGLGLAITKKLVELMQGQIVVQSIYRKGSRFTVAIDQKIIAMKSPEAPKETTMQTDRKLVVDGKRILVVDDNQLNLKVASLLLKKYNLEVDTVLSGQECIDKINAGERYDLILMDDMMPRMSGVETYQKLKEIPNFHIPTIALTANAIAGMREKYLADGFDDYLAKPISKTELARIIEKFLHHDV